MPDTVVYIIALLLGVAFGITISRMYHQSWCSGLTQRDYDNLVDKYNLAQNNYLAQLATTINLREKSINEIELSLQLMQEKQQLISTYKGLTLEVQELKQKLQNCEALLRECSALNDNNIKGTKLNTEVYA